MLNSPIRVIYVRHSGKRRNPSAPNRRLAPDQPALNFGGGRSSPGWLNGCLKEKEKQKNTCTKYKWFWHT